VIVYITSHNFCTLSVFLEMEKLDVHITITARSLLFWEGCEVSVKHSATHFIISQETELHRESANMWCVQDAKTQVQKTAVSTTTSQPHKSFSTNTNMNWEDGQLEWSNLAEEGKQHQWAPSSHHSETLQQVEYPANARSQAGLAPT
jgi:hypothetical protein